MFAVIDTIDTLNPVVAICETKADAEELLFDVCDEWVYEMIMTEDPQDAIDESRWNIYEDWRYLMRDASTTFIIQEVKIY